MNATEMVFRRAHVVAEIDEPPKDFSTAVATLFVLRNQTIPYLAYLSL